MFDVVDIRDISSRVLTRVRNYPVEDLRSRDDIPVTTKGAKNGMKLGIYGTNRAFSGVSASKIAAPNVRPAVRHVGFPHVFVFRNFVKQAAAKARRLVAKIGGGGVLV